jgi:two-component system, LytTR family, sensor histidine kinase AlgZ
MHPLLTSIRRYGLYLAAWIPLTAILLYLLAIPGHLGWRDAAVLVIPLCLIYQFDCLTAWYSCKVVPIQQSTFQRLLLTHLAAATVMSFLWVLIAKLLAYCLSLTAYFQGLDTRFAPQVPVLFGAGFLLYLLSVAFHYSILALEESRRAEARVLETSVLARDAELRALKAQVNPHFLFNSLNSISALTSMDPPKAREMCILLADFLRTTLGLGEKRRISFAEELALLHRYLAIEKVRFGSRLNMEENIQDETKTFLLPPMLLQPLIENAVTHGIANLPEGGMVRLASSGHDGRLSISIENSFDPDSTPLHRSGRGLKNVRDRLEASYGNEASMRVSTEAGRYLVELSIPAHSAKGQSEGNS